jgi:hypothetical protein
MREAAAIVARAKYGDAAWVLCHIVECDMSSYIHARSGRAGTSRIVFKFAGWKLI